MTVYDRKREETERIEAEKAKIVDTINPTEDSIDKRILFNLTGRRLNENDYQDESQSEGDIDVILDDLMGYSPRATVAEDQLAQEEANEFKAINADDEDEEA